MKIYISADMEGISGVTQPDFLNPGEINYEYGRSYMEHDVNAVIEAALESGATEIVVADSHGSGNNLRLSQLHSSVQLISGFPRDFYMMSGLTSEFDAVFLVGYHARHGMPGVLSHAYWFKNMKVNGTDVGEIGFNAMYAGMLGVPLAFVSGDDRAAEETKQLVPDAVTAVVKNAISRTAVRCLSLEQSRAELASKTKEAIRNMAKCMPIQNQLPAKVSIEFFHYGQAEMALSIPGTTLEPNSTIVTYTADDASSFYRTMESMATLANTVRFL